MFRKRSCRRCLLDLCDGDATVREKTSTYETMMPVGMRKWRGAMYIRKRRGESEEPWGVPTETGADMPGAPWKTRVHFLPVRKEETLSTMYEGILLERRRARSFVALTLSKPAFMSRKRVETFRRGLWRVPTSWVRVATASEVLRPGREPYWLGWSRPACLAREVSLTMRMRSRIFEMVLRRTMIRKEAGVSYDGFRGLSRTTSFECLSEVGWYPKATNRARRSRRRLGLVAFTLFPTEYGTPSGPGTEEGEDLDRAAAISSLVRATAEG